jgi:hypothetical protein
MAVIPGNRITRADYDIVTVFEKATGQHLGYVA